MQSGLGAAIGVEERYLCLLKGCLTRCLFPDEEVREVRGSDWTRSFVLPLRWALARRGLRLVRQEASLEERALGRTWPSKAETMVGLERLNNVQACVTDVLLEGVAGDLIETGVWRGGTTILMRAVLAAYGDTTRRVWVADSFQGLPRPDTASHPADAQLAGAIADPGDEGEARHGPGKVASRLIGAGIVRKMARRGPGCHDRIGWSADQGWWTRRSGFDTLVVSLEEVKANFARYGLLDSQVEFLVGWFKETLAKAPIDRLAVIRLDGDLYGSTMDALVALYPKLSVGGWIIVDDYSFGPCRQAVEDYRSVNHITEEIEKVDWTAICWRRRS